MRVSLTRVADVCYHDPCSRSIARIHENNLKKQAVLPLSFANPEDYSKIDSGDVVSTQGLNELLRGKLDAPLFVVVQKKNGQTEKIPVVHTMSQDQVSRGGAIYTQEMVEGSPHRSLTWCTHAYLALVYRIASPRPASPLLFNPSPAGLVQGGFCVERYRTRQAGVN